MPRAIAYTCQLSCLALIPLLAGVFLPQAARAQDCSFEPSEAVADTLDPTGYYPLQVGNTWEYRGEAGGFPLDPWREEILGDTLIEGKEYFVKKHTEFTFIGLDSLVVSSESVSTLAVVDSGLMGPQYFVAIPFGADFNTCYDHTEGFYWIEGGYGESTGLPGVEVTAVKQISMVGGGRTYGYGLGPINGWGDPDGLEEITYLKVGEIEYGQPLEVRYTVVSTTIEQPEPVQEINLFPSAPNPFQKTTTIAFTLEYPAEVTLIVYDAVGREVTQLVDGQRPAGTHEVPFEASHLPSGVYFYRLQAGERVDTRQMVLLK